jgi:F-type H+-transporting ATPase subunit delta
MSVNTRVADRYAKSLIDLATEENKLEKILSDIEIFKASLQSRDLYLMLKSPIIHADKKNSILNLLFKDKFDAMTMGFVEICTRKGREDILPEIVEQFLVQYNIMKKISRVLITTATPIDEATLTEIKEKLLKSTSTGDSLEITTKIDPSIIGGYTVEMDNKLYDASVAHKLENLKKQFSSNLYEKKLYK